MRLLRGLKQNHLADLLGVDQATVSRWERGLSAMPVSIGAQAEKLLAPSIDAAEDAALRRLVETSTARTHLICDETHRLLAASPARVAEWRSAPAQMIGRSLFVFASPEIRAMEETLTPRGWREARVAHIIFETGANTDTTIPIASGIVRWERLALASGAARRIVTTLA